MYVGLKKNPNFTRASAEEGTDCFGNLMYLPRSCLDSDHSQV